MCHSGMSPSLFLSQDINYSLTRKIITFAHIYIIDVRYLSRDRYTILLYGANKFVRAIKRDYYKISGARSTHSTEAFSLLLSLTERKIIESSNGDRLKK